MTFELCKKPYCIWWAYGFLRKNERNLWKSWGALLQRAVQDEGLTIGEKPSYHFHWLARCTGVQFIQIWESSASAALFWVSHGDQGYPIPYEWEYENRDPTKEESVETRLEPGELPRAGKNMRAVALISCESHFHEAEWKMKLPRDAEIKTFIGIVDASAKPAAAITEFMKFRSYDEKHTGPQAGARYMLRTLTYLGPAGKAATPKPQVTKPSGVYAPSSSGGCSCPFSSRSRVPGAVGTKVATAMTSARRGPLGHT